MRACMPPAHTLTHMVSPFCVSPLYLPPPSGAAAAFLPLLGMPLEVCPSARRGEQLRSERIPFLAVPTMPNTRTSERAGCDGGGGARGNINMPPFTPHTLTLFPPTSPSFPPSFLPSLARSSPPRPRSHMGGRKGRKRRREERNAGTTAPRGKRPRREENELGQRTRRQKERERE